MSRMHTRKRGKSKSRRLHTPEEGKISQLTNDEIIKTAVDLKKSGLTNSVIGVRLRDQYAVPGTRTELGAKLNTIFKENNLSDPVPEDLMSLIKRYKNVKAHTEVNRKDQSNIRGQGLIMAKILRLVKYYKREGYLPEEWNLNRVL
ncbi:MAG: 30S ribosomal protein S15 [Thermoplasmatales archaeon]|nr:30S ribosomal protein S15 [Thermoplasmatales archaeon]MCW6170275.1 30S ribosomal protein S15 [Thermoplasmatales archaeon]